VTAWAVCQGHAVDRGAAPHLDARRSEGQVAALPAARNTNPNRSAYSFCCSYKRWKEYNGAFYATVSCLGDGGRV
jgi:hypothetical protein